MIFLEPCFPANFAARPSKRGQVEYVAIQYEMPLNHTILDLTPYPAPLKVVVLVAGALLLALCASAGEPADPFANMPDYTLKEGSVGSPRTDVPWLRVCFPALAEEKKKAVCQITAVVQRSFDAYNRMSHTEYIAEVVLQKSDRSILKEETVVLHSDRWNDLVGEKANPFKPKSTVIIKVRGDPKNLSSLKFKILKISHNHQPQPTRG